MDLGADGAGPRLPLVAGQPGWHRAVGVHLVEGDGDGGSHLEETAWHVRQAPQRGPWAACCGLDRRSTVQAGGWADRGPTVGSRPDEAQAGGGQQSCTS